MSNNDFFVLGRVTKKHGFNGVVSIFLDTDRPDHYQNLESAFIVINDKPVPFFFKQFQVRNNTARVQIEGIDTADQAEPLIGNEVILPDSMLPPLKGNKFYFHEVIGFKVIDDHHGELGNVTNIIESGGNAVFEITDGNTEVLIPVTDQFIKEVNRKDKSITVSTPDGLIDIYRE